MSQEQKCYLCEKSASVSSAVNENKDVNRVECETCGIYYLGSPTLFEKDYKEMPREKRAMLSAYTRQCFELEEEPPELGNTDLLKDIIAEYENKTLDNKVKNLILNLREKSSQYGELVSWAAENDYPITYSFGHEGSTKIRDLAVEKGLIDWTAKSTGLKLTEEGWKLGTELKKIAAIIKDANTRG
jgi:hypothetical protein